jgi:hypothetical protein
LFVVVALEPQGKQQPTNNSITEDTNVIKTRIFHLVFACVSCPVLGKLYALLLFAKDGTLHKTALSFYHTIPQFYVYFLQLKTKSNIRVQACAFLRVTPP